MKMSEYDKVLDSFQLGIAEKNTLNDMAFYAQKKARKIQAKKLTLRNKWTIKGTLVQKARRIGDSAYMGSVRDYMLRQEYGGTHKPKTGSRSVPVYSPYATSNKLGSNPPKRLPTRRNRLKNLKKVDVASRSLRNVSAKRVFGAHNKYGSSSLMLHKGVLWRKKGKGKHVPIWNFNTPNIRVKKHDSIFPAGEGAMKVGQMFFNKNLKYQLRKYGKK
jgi:hypothetical protein